MKFVSNSCPVRKPWAVLAWHVMEQAEKDIRLKTCPSHDRISAVRFLETDSELKRLYVDIISCDLDAARKCDAMKQSRVCL